MLQTDKMSEAEVSIRLAFFLIEQKYTISDVQVAIDGAQIKTSDTIHFPIIDFLASYKWIKKGRTAKWQDTYYNHSYQSCIVIHARSGQFDVVANLKSGKTLRVECKKGPLSRSKSSQEYPLIRGGLGQLLTIEQVENNDILAIAVPSSDKFEELSKKWREAPLIKKCSIRILTVDRENNVKGLYYMLNSSSKQNI